MKKFSLVVEKKKQELIEIQTISERNLYLDFAKKYHKEHGVSGPFDKKFKGDKNAQADYRDWETDRKSTRLNSSHSRASRMPSSA